MTILSRSIAVFVAASAVASAVLALIGPFGTFDDLTLGRRLVYWTAIVFLNGIQVSLFARALVPRMAPPRWPLAAPLALAGLAASVPATAEVYWLEAWFRPGTVGVGDILPLFGFVAVVTLALSVPMGMLVFQAGRPAPASDEAAAPAAGAAAPEVPFLRRIPGHLGGELLCVQTEDHYLRVHTTAGNDLILMRLRDALDELAAADGLQVHRSHWVARAAVDRVERDGNRTVLCLTNGLTVPVSRTHLAGLRAAGWLNSPRNQETTAEKT
ncbi:MAG: LytTR family transcriptional regulator [Hyphomicrobiales bacterium]|nr:LytTR family transcriptional regulator [Hyphomicrobiales bacterium]MCP5372394.1 LytTR family transcriptional regulator [Hyphomicrobiales bacterium]